MQRWFFANEPEDCEARRQPPVKFVPKPPSREPSPIPERLWRFCVLVKNRDLMPNEHIAVVGSCETLGNWEFQLCVVLTKEETSNIWTVEITIPADRDVGYRFLICAIDPANDVKIVRFWETHLVPRLIPALLIEIPECSDVFGELNCCEKVDRGWLTSETLVQLKFFNAPFAFKQRMKNRLLYVKVTPLHMNKDMMCDPNAFSGTHFSPLNDSLSIDTLGDRHDNTDHLSTAFAFNEVVSLNPDHCKLEKQPQFGTACGPDNLIIFHLTIGDYENTVYLIDLYTYSSKRAPDEPPYHLGYHHIMPTMFKRSDGYLDVQITCAAKHRPLGVMQFGYLIVRPCPKLDLTMKQSFTRYWNPRWTGLDVGHRGLGASFTTNGTNIRENTIYSLKHAAASGADMVEFDVQLSKDNVPVVYHDFKVYVSLKTKVGEDKSNLLALPMRDLTYKQLRTLKVYTLFEGKLRLSRCSTRDDSQDHQPFPRLADVLDAVDPNVGFNIEIKWAQRHFDGTMEDDIKNNMDRNFYVDHILKEIFTYAGSRRIFLSCFDADMCTMLRFKQNRYPVLYLTIGEATRYKKFKDPRGNSIKNAVLHSIGMELIGIVANTEDILRDPTQVNLTKGHGLVIFCWGDDNNSRDNIRLLKHIGLHAIIYDKMDVLSTKSVKKSVFLLAAETEHVEFFKTQAIEINRKYFKS